MNRLSAIWAAVVAGILSTLVLPATAWAAENDIVARRPKGIGFGGIFGLLCCLVVVGVIGLVIFLVIKNQQKKR